MNLGFVHSFQEGSNGFIMILVLETKMSGSVAAYVEDYEDCQNVHPEKLEMGNA